MFKQCLAVRFYHTSSLEYFQASLTEGLWRGLALLMTVVGEAWGSLTGGTMISLRVSRTDSDGFWPRKFS